MIDTNIVTHELVSVSYRNISFEMLRDNSVGIGGDKWPATDLFCNLLCDSFWGSFFSSLLDNKSCIELGSGTGIVGVVLERLYSPRSIVLTDLESHVSLIYANVTHNSLQKTQVMEYDWKLSKTSEKFDVILAFEW